MIARIGLALLFVDELIVGAWNQFWPAGFYANFPTVDLDPPFSEHYARDFGGATLGIAAVLLVALIAPRPVLIATASLAFSLFAVPHFVFHAAHLDHATTAESLFLLIGNGLVAVVGILLGVFAVVRMTRDRDLHHPAVG